MEGILPEARLRVTHTIRQREQLGVVATRLTIMEAIAQCLAPEPRHQIRLRSIITTRGDKVRQTIVEAHGVTQAVVALGAIQALTTPILVHAKDGVIHPAIGVTAVECAAPVSPVEEDLVVAEAVAT